MAGDRWGAIAGSAATAALPGTRTAPANAVIDALQRAGVPINAGSAMATQAGVGSSYRPSSTPARSSSSSSRSGGGSSSSGYRSGSRGGGGGGGGGGSGVGAVNQARMDQLAAMLRNSKPGQQVANTINIPRYQAPARAAFDSSMYDNFGNQWQQAYQQDAATQATAGQNLLAFLAAQTNPYTNGNNTYATAGQAPGQSIAQLQQLAQAQGVDPSILAQAYGERIAADQAFGNMWRSNAAAGDQAQQGRMASAQQSIADWANNLNANRRAGEAQIGLARGQAQNRYNERSEEFAREDAQMAQQVAMQEAMANWERANQVSDANTSNSNAYRNAVLEALLGLVPSLPANVALPDISSWGM